MDARRNGDGPTGAAAVNGRDWSTGGVAVLIKGNGASSSEFSARSPSSIGGLFEQRIRDRSESVLSDDLHQQLARRIGTKQGASMIACEQFPMDIGPALVEGR